MNEEIPELSKPRSKKRRWLMVAALLGVPVLLTVGLRMVIAHVSSPQGIVDRIEAAMNARVEIDSTQLTLFRAPPMVELRGVRMFARDDAADNALPLGDRPKAEMPLITAAVMRLEASPWALLTRKLDISDLTVEEAGAILRVRENGKLNVEKLFKKPAIVNGKPNPKVKQKVVNEAAGQGLVPGTVVDALEEEPVEVDDVPLATTIKHLLISGATIETLFKSNGTRIDVSELRFEISDFDLDPNNLAEHNRATIRIAGVINVDQPEKKKQLAEFNILGEGKIRPFDPVNKTLDPVVNATITFQDTSEIQLLPSLQKMGKKLEVLKKVGINLGDQLGTSVTFSDQTTVAIEYSGGTFRTLSPLYAKAGDMDCMLGDGSFVKTDGGDHEFRVLLMGDEKFSKKLLEKVQEKSRIIPEGPSRDAFMKELTDSFFPDGKFRPEALSTGLLGDPDIQIQNKMPDMGKFVRGMLQEIGLDPEVQKDLQDSAGKLLEGLLKGK